MSICLATLMSSGLSKNARAWAWGSRKAGLLPIVFFILAEHERVNRARLMLDAYAIRHYVRFEDDIFIVLARTSADTNAMNMNRKFVSHIRVRAGSFFQIAVECVSRSKVEMLAVTVTKDSAGKFTTVPKPKPFNMYLDPASAHAPSVHNS